MCSGASIVLLRSLVIVSRTASWWIHTLGARTRLAIHVKSCVKELRKLEQHFNPRLWQWPHQPISYSMNMHDGAAPDYIHCSTCRAIHSLCLSPPGPHCEVEPCRTSCCGLMNSSLHCPMVSMGLLTVCPRVLGLEKISKSLPPCTATHVKSNDSVQP